MKKTIAFLSVLSVILTTNAVTVFAADAPVNIEAALYDQLMENGTYDTNEDGIISETEFRQINYLNLDLADITSLDFLNELSGLRSLYLHICVTAAFLTFLF